MTARATTGGDPRHHPSDGATDTAAPPTTFDGATGADVPGGGAADGGVTDGGVTDAATGRAARNSATGATTNVGAMSGMGSGGTNTPGAVRRSLRQQLRRPHPALVMTVLAVIVTAVVLVVVGSRGAAPLPLDPGDGGSRGTRALDHVLAERGVSSRVVRSAEDFDPVLADSSTTLVVPNPGLLSENGLDALQGAFPGRLVLVAPDSQVLDELDVPATVVGGSAGSALPAECDTDLAAPTDSLAGGGVLYRTTAPGASACFPDRTDDADDPAHPPSGLLDLPAKPGRPRTIVVGQTDVFTNVGITEESHAALALRALGGTERVLWYQPETSLDETPVGQAPPAPPWVAPTLLLLGATTLVLCLWRGRRLGPLATEPLPVVVPAEETTLARARLYRRTADATGIGTLLQDAALDDLRRTLRLPPSADSRRVADAAADRLGEPDPRRIHDLLTRPVTARDLPETTDALRHLRRKVRRT